MDASILGKIRQCFDHVPLKDTRAKIGPREFLVSLLFALSADSKRKSLDGLRREVKDQSGVSISRSSFWERLATNRLRRLLVTTLAELMKSLSSQVGLNAQLLGILKVRAIYLIDACSTSLPDDAAEQYPAPRNNVIPSAIKWHMCLDILSGVMRWSCLTPATDHDRKHFPPISMLKGALIIFDLGYWDYQLLADLMCNGCFFLCRIKTNAVIPIIGVSKSAPQYKLLGRNLFDFDWSRKRQDVVEVLGAFYQQKEELFQARVIGFWNPVAECYHWYTTNLVVAAKIIYPAYRLRWQIELIFKAVKGSLRLEDAPSSNKNIIWSLILCSLIANLIAQPLAKAVASDEKSEAKKASISVQRAATMLRHVAPEFQAFILERSRAALGKLKKKLILFAEDLFDPNYRSRESTVRMIMQAGELAC